ncbi:hypothetical protein QCM8_198 [Bacillus phage QCM8]|nr:hypothetical protein QCM8_198 [Bacillus phage QCM8]
MGRKGTKREAKKI